MAKNKKKKTEENEKTEEQAKAPEPKKSGEKAQEPEPKVLIATNEENEKEPASIAAIAGITIIIIVIFFQFIYVYSLAQKLEESAHTVEKPDAEVKVNAMMLRLQKLEKDLPQEIAATAVPELKKNLEQIVKGLSDEKRRELLASLEGHKAGDNALQMMQLVKRLETLEKMRSKEPAANTAKLEQKLRTLEIRLSEGEKKVASLKKVQEVSKALIALRGQLNLWQKNVVTDIAAQQQTINFLKEQVKTLEAQPRETGNTMVAVNNVQINDLRNELSNKIIAQEKSMSDWKEQFALKHQKTLMLLQSWKNELALRIDQEQQLNKKRNAAEWEKFGAEVETKWQMFKKELAATIKTDDSGITEAQMAEWQKAILQKWNENAGNFVVKTDYQNLSKQHQQLKTSVEQWQALIKKQATAAEFLQKSIRSELDDKVSAVTKKMDEQLAQKEQQWQKKWDEKRTNTATTSTEGTGLTANSVDYHHLSDKLKTIVLKAVTSGDIKGRVDYNQTYMTVETPVARFSLPLKFAEPFDNIPQVWANVVGNTRLEVLVEDVTKSGCVLVLKGRGRIASGDYTVNWVAFGKRP